VLRHAAFHVLNAGDNQKVRMRIITLLEKYIVGKESYNNELINPMGTAVDNNNVQICFQLHAKGPYPSSAEGAIYLVITRLESKW